MLSFRMSGCSAAVARLVWDQEVGGSIPLTPTTFSGIKLRRKAFCPLQTDSVVNVLLNEWALHLIPTRASRLVSTLATPLELSSISSSTGEYSSRYF
jgi:hypothetical protein